MDDFTFDASTESAAPADSGVIDASATSASSDGVGTEQVIQPATESANADTPAAESIDAGWTLDDDKEQTIPDDDKDIEALSKDPLLDQEKLPGLVEALRNARQSYREQHKEYKSVQSQLNQFQEYGGVEGVTQTLGLVSQLLSGQPEGTTAFLQSLYDQAQPAYAQLVTDAIKYNPDYALQQLQQMGKIPENIAQASASSLDAETLAGIPEHLRSTAKSLPAHVMEDLMLQSDEVRNYNLERELKLQQLDTTQRQAAEAAYQQQARSAYETGQKLAADLSNQYEQAHLSQLNKWQPYGPENKVANERVYGEIMEGAYAEVLKDQKFAQMYQDAQRLLAEAPMRRMRNEGMAADQDERKARAMAAQFNTRLGQVVRERVKERDSIYKDARAWREHQRQFASNRTEISGMAASAPSGTRMGALGPDGKANPAFLEQLANSIPG